ncbi:MAG TPA: phosphoribosylanthranilate isomerase [Solirubrobacterales bacterium]|nr:phosphoribosylanthranilate isomerase [Solirubrobacterales bacterium]
MRVKICGITNHEDAEAAVHEGAWAIGLNFVHESPRCADGAEAEEIGAAIKRRAEVAGVFANAKLGRIADLAERCALTIVQLHGEEGPSFCREVGRRTGCKVIKAFRVRSSAEIRGAAAYRTDFHLFDAYRPGTRGGTGESFDWELVGDRDTGIPAIVAGGLTPENVGEAITVSRPYAVDVAGGVEDGRPGRKDHDLIRRFIGAANEAGATITGGGPDEAESERTPA